MPSNAERKIHFEDDIDIIKASYDGNTELVKRIVNSGVDVNTTEYGTGFTPLHISCGRNHVELFSYLMSVPQINLVAQDRWGRTPAMIAHENGDASGFVASIERRILDQDAPRP